MSNKCDCWLGRYKNISQMTFLPQKFDSQTLNPKCIPVQHTGTLERYMWLSPTNTMGLYPPAINESASCCTKPGIFCLSFPPPFSYSPSLHSFLPSFFFPSLLLLTHSFIHSFTRYNLTLCDDVHWFQQWEFHLDPWIKIANVLFVEK